MKRFSDKIRPFSLALAFLMPVAIDGALLADVLPKVLVAERKEKLGLDDIEQLTKETEEAIKLQHYSKAIDLYERILELQEKNLGPNHPDIATSLNDLGDLYHDDQKLYSKAEPLYLRALSIREKVLGTELVVISGCESGKGDIQSGEGVYGLKRAIAVAGARSSLLQLWEVDDEATAAFMKSFYERLKKGDGRAEALAATQEEFRNHSIPGWRHPYVWAAFQLSGNWRPIDW